MKTSPNLGFGYIFVVNMLPKLKACRHGFTMILYIKAYPLTYLQLAKKDTPILVCMI